MRKSILIALCSILVIGVSGELMLFAYYPRPALPRCNFVIENGVILPFANCDFTKGSWRATVRIDLYDFNELDSRVKRRIFLTCSDIATLQEMQKTWRFTQTEGDMATVSSSFLLEKDGVTYFSTAVILSKEGAGFQSKDFGWAPAVDRDAFFRCLARFH